MSKKAKFVKLANDFDKLGHYEEATAIDRLLKTATHRCNCENEACEKLREHRPGSCKKPPGQFKALYIGPICDGCAENLPSEYLTSFKNDPMPDRIASLNKEAGDDTSYAADFLAKAQANYQDLLRLLPANVKSSPALSEVLKRLDSNLRLVQRELIMLTKGASLELEMEKEVEVSGEDDEDDEDSDDDKVEKKTKKITLSFD